MSAVVPSPLEPVRAHLLIENRIVVVDRDGLVNVSVEIGGAHREGDAGGSVAIHVPSVVRHLSVDGPRSRLAERHAEEVPAQVGQDRLGVGEVLWLPRWQGVGLNLTVAQHEGDRCDVCTGQRDLCGGTGTGNRHRLGSVDRAQIHRDAPPLLDVRLDGH